MKGIQKSHVQGKLVRTENNLDLALEGPGYFNILLPDGATAHTRTGQFQLDKEGRIVTSQGYPVQPTITVPPDTLNLSISRDGVITTLSPGQTQPTELGTINIAYFTNPEGLLPIGNNLYRATASSGDAQIEQPGVNGRSYVQQGFAENSNVNVVEEIVNMVDIQRLYEMAAKALGIQGDMVKSANQEIR